MNVNDVRVTPRSHVLELRAGNAAFVWHRPDSLVVEQPDGTQALPIVDVTRLAQVALLLLAVTLTLLSIRSR